MKASSLKNEREKKKKGVQNTVQAMNVKTSCARTLLCDTHLHPMSFASHPQNRFFRCFDKSTMTTARDTNILNEQQSGMMMNRLKKSKRMHRTYTHIHIDTHKKNRKPQHTCLLFFSFSSFLLPHRFWAARNAIFTARMAARRSSSAATLAVSP